MVQIGHPITEEQKELFNRLLSTNDLVELSTTVNVSYATVKALAYRTQPVTENNKEAVVKMINKSFEKAENAITYFTKAKHELEAMLPKVNG